MDPAEQENRPNMATQARGKMAHLAPERARSKPPMLLSRVLCSFLAAFTPRPYFFYHDDLLDIEKKESIKKDLLGNGLIRRQRGMGGHHC